MKSVKHLRILLVLLPLLSLIAPGAALGAESPGWNLISLATPTQFVAGNADGRYTFDVRVANVGATVTDGSDITIADTLPEGLVVKDTHLRLRSSKSVPTFDYGEDACDLTTAGATQTVTCVVSESLELSKQPALVFPGEELRLEIGISVPGSVGEGKTLVNHVEVEGGGAAPAAITTENETATLDGEGNPMPPAPGITYIHSPVTGMDGEPVGNAAAHPYQLTTSFAFNTVAAPKGGVAPYVVAGGDAKDIQLALPPGLIGNPNAATRCTSQQFDDTHSRSTSLPGGASGTWIANACPDSSALGLLLIQQVEGSPVRIFAPLYNLVPPAGMPAQFGFQILDIPFYINFTVRNGTDYGIVSTLHNTSQVKRVTAATVIVWGTPSDDRHDPIRGSCVSPFIESIPLSFGACPADGADPRPLLRMPTSCVDPLDLRLNVSLWTDPDNFLTKLDPYPIPFGCNQLTFEPTLKARPTTDVADSPSGLDVDVHVPQEEDPEGLATPDLRNTVVTLPEGIALNPSSANGLGSCAPSEVGVTSTKGALPVQFTPDPSSCPPEARIGTAEVDTPLLDHPLKGGVYVATPHDNPFDSLLALYITANDAESGVNLKLAGKAEADPQTGQLRTTFAETPQQPFEHFRLQLFGGAGAALRTPQACGTFSTTSELTPWSAPESGPPATPSDTYEIKKSPGGGNCVDSVAALPHSPTFDAGTEAPIAGAHSPFLLNLSREDGTAEFSSLTTTLPPGLSGKLAGISYCPDAALAAAAQRSGRAERQSPSCPAGSRVGTVTVGAGAGPRPYYTTGAAYLAGPYKGAPLSLAVVTPATAGPYDLGTVVVHTALRLDPTTAQITAATDEIPHMLEGIPLDIRTIAVRLDRRDFTLNPTSCDPMAITGGAGSVLGQVAPLSSRFQVGECDRLGFKPKLSFRLRGKTRRGGFPALTATLTMPPGSANVARVSATLPRSEFIEQAHFQTICTRVQYAAGQCPAGSVYGHVRAYSPLLDRPLEGPAYLRSSSNKLPDLVFSLDGQIHVDAVGRVDSVKGGLRTTFETVPDAPLSKVVLKMAGGKKGLFVNSRDICAKRYRASVEFDAHNGKIAESQPVLKAACKGKQPTRQKPPKHAARRARG